MNEKLIRELLHIAKQINDKEISLVRLLEQNDTEIKFLADEVNRILDIVKELLRIELDTYSEDDFWFIVTDYILEKILLNEAIQRLKDIMKEV